MDISHIADYTISLLTLTFLEVVLGVDNLVFIAIAVSRLPKEKQRSVRIYGLLFAMITRLVLLAGVFWIAHFTKPVFTIADFAVSVRDILMFFGGLFLMYKATQEMQSEISNHPEEMVGPSSKSVMGAILQIGVLDIVFSFDSVITAIGMTDHLSIMSIAIIIAICIMLFMSDRMTDFINANPTVKILALSFLLMIGTMLVADATHFHVPRQYLYFSISFSLFVEFMNMLVRNKRAGKK